MHWHHDASLTTPGNASLSTFTDGTAVRLSCLRYYLRIARLRAGGGVLPQLD